MGHPTWVLAGILALLVPGCLHISDDEHAARLDPDGDGVPWPDDRCTGDDATGDSDGDGRCDDQDLCVGDDDEGDADGDGTCADLDCDDGDALRAPDLTEVTGDVDDRDEDCDGVIACWQDGDRDGFGVALAVADDGDGACLVAAGESRNTDDCDDSDARIFPPRCDNRPPTAVLTLSTRAPAPGATLELDATGSVDPDGDPLAYAFDLDGDGVYTSAGPDGRASLVADGPGLHRVGVEVDDGLARAQATAWIRVVDPPSRIDVSPEGTNSTTTLEQALELSEATPGRQVVVLSPGVYATAGQLPVLTDPDGLTLVGETGAVVDGSARGRGNTLVLEGGPSQVVGVHLRGFELALSLEATGSVVLDSTFTANDTAIVVTAATVTIGPGVTVEDGAGDQVVLDAPATVIGTVVQGGNTHGIVLDGGADGARVVATVVSGHVGAGIRVVGAARGGADDVSITDNTVFANGTGMALEARADAADLRNNLLVGNGTGLVADEVPGRLDYNGWFDNTVDCEGCAPGPHAVRADPVFVAEALGDLRLGKASPCVDAGTTTGVDKTGLPDMPYHRGAPDLGALEQLPPVDAP